MSKLSVVLATFNEEENLADCLESVKGLADEIVVVDGSSTDKTVQIARKFGAKVFIKDNPPIFHINKQKALDTASYNWILQLDADERVSQDLKDEIKKVIFLSEKELEIYQNNLSDRQLFVRHQKLVEKRDELIKSDGQFVAFYIPRLNYFLGKYLKHGGVYPDGVIRLFMKGKAHFPCIDVHEQIKVNGRVGWLQNPLYHKDSPTFKRYIERNNRYIDLLARQMRNDNIRINLRNSINYLVIKPVWWFLLTQIRHKGILDGFQGVIFSFFSSLRFPRAYLKYKSICQKNIK